MTGTVTSLQSVGDVKTSDIKIFIDGEMIGTLHESIRGIKDIKWRMKRKFGREMINNDTDTLA